MKRNVPRKRRKVKGRIQESTFSGSDAVYTVFLALNDQDINQHIVKDVSREKAVKLCQSFLENKIIESLGSKHWKNKLNFSDSPSRYYRFCADDDWETAGDDVTDSTPDQLGSRVNYAFDDSADSMTGVTPMSKNLAELLRLSGAKFHRRTGSLDDASRRGSVKRSASIPPRRLFTKRSPTAHGADEILREIALSKLLLMIDLPLLDNLLQDSCKNKAHWTNVNQSTVNCQTMLDCVRDEWTRTALDCIEMMPKSERILDTYLVESNEIVRKLNLYQAVVQFYRSLEESIIPEGFGDVMVKVLHFINQGRDDLAVRALQLVMMLLPLTSCQLLERLVCFMKAVCQSDLSVDSQFSNRTVLEQNFSAAILQPDVVSSAQCRVLVLYILDHTPAVFTVPRDARQLADRRLVRMKTASMESISEAPEFILQPSFCSRVSKRDFEEQKGPGTDRELVKLMNAVLDDTKLTIKDKKYRLKQFQKHHPKLFSAHFSEYL